MKIYTKTGDKGSTSLFGGQRVAKNHIRVEAYGSVDELNACLGLAAAHLPEQSPIFSDLRQAQMLLFELGADLATPPERQGKKRPAAITHEDVATLEAWIDAAEAQLPPLTSFILPTGTAAAATLHLARTVCRRSERVCVALSQVDEQTPETIITFMNRLSDLLFVWARLANHQANQPDTPWQARGRCT